MDDPAELCTFEAGSDPTERKDGKRQMRRFLKLGATGPVEVPESEATVIYYTTPTKEDRQELGQRWAIDDHSLEAALDPDEVPRVEFAGSNMNLLWKRPTSTRQEKRILFNVASMGVFLRGDRMIVVLSDEYFPLGGQDFAQATTLASFLLRLLHHTVLHYFEHLKVIKMISREMQGKIESSMDNQLMLNMFDLGESLTYYLNALESDGAVLRKLQTNPEKLSLGRPDLEYLEDLQIDHEQCRKITEIYDSVLEGMVAARSGIMNNNMNMLLKNLTVINLVFLPLNLLAGIGGMSEYTSLLGGLNKGLGYALGMLGMTLIGIGTWWLLSRYVDGFNHPSRRHRKIRL